MKDTHSPNWGGKRQGVGRKPRKSDIRIGDYFYLVAPGYVAPGVALECVEITPDEIRLRMVLNHERTFTLKREAHLEPVELLP